VVPRSMPTARAMVLILLSRWGPDRTWAGRPQVYASTPRRARNLSRGGSRWRRRT